MSLPFVIAFAAVYAGFTICAFRSPRGSEPVRRFCFGLVALVSFLTFALVLELLLEVIR